MRIYTPNQPVAHVDHALARWVYSEFRRVADAVETDPVYSTASGDIPALPIGGTANWQQLVLPAVWDIPGGGYDAATGVYTAQIGGLYKFDARMRIDAFNAGGNREYYAGLRIGVTQPGEAETFTDDVAGGSDGIPLTVRITVQWPMLAGAEARLYGTAVHENQTGTVAATAYWMINREGSA